MKASLVATSDNADSAPRQWNSRLPIPWTTSSSSGMVCKPACLRRINRTRQLTQSFQELEEIVSAQCQSHELIDNALRSYLTFTTNYKGSPPSYPTIIEESSIDRWHGQENTYIRNMILAAAAIGSLSPLSLLRIRTMCDSRSSAACSRYVRYSKHTTHSY